jgi:succinate dehydrogenase/fumarate reductase flavoprotein subunit
MASNIKTLSCDVLVLGGGNAGFSAALAAAQSKVGKVILIDRCPLEWAGGNSHFTAGAFRISHDGLPDILPIVSNVDDETAKAVDLDPYTNAHFLADMARITNGQYDRKLGKILADSSNEAIKWLAENGLKFHLSFNRQVCIPLQRYLT